MPDDLFSGQVSLPEEVAEEEFLAQAEGQIRGYGKLVSTGIVEIGRKLTEVKDRTGYQGFLTFVKDRLRWSEMQASRFVNVYQMFSTNKLLVTA